MIPTLRPYQINTLAAIAAARVSGLNRLLVKSPTGTGKTVTFAAMLSHPDIRARLDRDDPEWSMLVIAHREELLEQAAEKIQAANPDLIVAIEQGARYAPPMCDVVVASIQTLAAMKFRRLHALIQGHAFKLVIVDEAHHAAAATYRTALVHLGFLPPSDSSESENVEAAHFDDIAAMEQSLATWESVAPKDRLLVGFTATPNRSDAIGLGCVFQQIVYSYALRAAITDGWLVPLTPWAIETGVDLTEVKVTAGEYNQRDLADHVNNQRRNQLAVTAWGDYAAGRSTLAFTVDVDHARALATEFLTQGVRAAYVSGETPKPERRDILRRFTLGELDVITNCMVLTEGTDLPRASCILHAKPTRSATLYEQMTGRGLRLYPDKTDCIVIDLVDVARRHSLQTAPALYGLPPSLKVDGKPLDATAEAWEEFAETHPGFNADGLGNGLYTLEDFQARARTFSVWGVPEIDADFARGRLLQWLKAGDEYRLTYPHGEGRETIVISADLVGRWSARRTCRSNEPVSKSAAPAVADILTTNQPTATAAASCVEDYVKQWRRSAFQMQAVAAGWRQNPASLKQLNLLIKLRVPVRAGLTAGEASSLIDLANARRVRAAAR